MTSFTLQSVSGKGVHVDGLSEGNELPGGAESTSEIKIQSAI